MTKGESMNSVQLIGRLTKNPEVRYTNGNNPMAVTTFTLAVDRKTKEKQADFIRITVFGRQAENCERYIQKGSKVAVEGRIQTGKYEDKDGKTVYTTDVIANHVEFLDSRQTESYGREAPMEQFAQVNEDVPF
jgi:single-strand DNA-binding protein